jgi:hypothetical protein
MRLTHKAYFFVLAVCLSGSISVYAQGSGRVKKNWFDNVAIAPSGGAEILSIQKYNSTTNGYSVVYKGVPSLRYGFDVNMKKNEKLVIHTGLHYAAKNFTRKETSPDATNGYYYDSKYRNRYLESYLGGTFNFMHGRFDAGLYSNLNLSMLMSSRETRLTETGNRFIYDHKPYNSKMLGSFEPGLNFNYNFNYRLSFGVKSGYRLYFNSISLKKEYKQNSVLIQSGLFYRF